MKKSLLLILVLLAGSAVILSSCKKSQRETIKEPEVVVNTSGNVDVYAGLGTHEGYPYGEEFKLPPYVKICGYIRGGIAGKSTIQDKSFKGPFPGSQSKAWVDYGTGTFVNLYVKFYNSLPTQATLTLPGGLIFIDSADYFNRDPVYQKGFILQAVHVQLPALDTAFACLRAYCLNHTLAPSSYNAVYFMGPVTLNPDLATIVGIMAPKQYPFGHEYDIQTILWNVTDYGLGLSPADTAYLNGLP